MLDVLVLGAGPAGAALAARLLQRGVRDFAVLERYRFPRDKPCGGGLTGHADEAFAQLGLALRVPAVAAHAATVRVGGFTREVTMQRPVNVVRRIDFDADLVAQARERGAEILEGEGATALVVRADAVEVTTTAGRTLRARVVVGADGVASIVRRHLRANRRELPHRLFMQELDGVRPAGLGDAMVYDFSCMPDAVRGYLWLFPAPGGRCNVGIMHYPSDRRGGAWLTDKLRRGLAHWGVELPAKGARGWPAYGYEPRAPVAAPRLLTIGDAAGIDGLTGEGIAVAMEQAILAGDEIAAALRSGDLSFAGFGRKLRRAVIGRELTLDRRLASLLYQRGERWREWMSLVLFDPDMLSMYAARVSGGEVLADQRWRLLRALGRHVRHRGARRRRLEEALAAPRRASLTPPAP
ncbi:MAG: NAD(P)/FAD-dependent oxidoreductase [Kofleriaceae bacterium]